MMKVRKWSIATVVLMMALLLVMSMSASAAQPRISMDYQNVEARDVLASIAQSYNVNIVVDESVKGLINVRLDNVPLDQALDIIIKTKGFTYQKMQDGTIVVADAKTLLAGYGEATVFPMNFALAKDVKDALAGVVPDSHLKVDIASNSLVHFGPPAEAAIVRSALEALDISRPQVIIEAQVLEMTKEGSKNIGVEWTWAAGPLQSSASGSENFENKGAIRFGKAPNGSPYEFRFQGKINAMVSSGDAKVLAKPRVSTLSGKEARILIGDKIPVQKEQIVDGKIETTIEYVETGIRLVYTPVVSPEGTIRAHLLTEVSEPLPALNNTNYKIRTRTTETDLRMQDGETLVIGGLMSSNYSNTKSRVPFLGDLPLVGGFFRNDSGSNKDSEIVVILTAKLVK